MYTLVDLVENTAKKFDTQERLLSFWRWEIVGRTRFPEFIGEVMFDELNITGKDKHYISLPFSYASDFRLGRYQVLDEYGRSCDIRTWTSAIQSVLAETYPSWRRNPSKKTKSQPRFRIDPVSCGYKRHHASHKLNTYTKQKLKDIRNKFELDTEDDLYGLTPIRDHSKPRIPDQNFRGWKISDNKCWKTRSKRRAQWERHMRQAPETRGPSRDEEYDLVMSETCCEMADEREELLRQKEEIEQELLEYADMYDDVYDYYRPRRIIE